jgi:hypothetical protein
MDDLQKEAIALGKKMVASADSDTQRIGQQLLAMITAAAFGDLDSVMPQLATVKSHDVPGGDNKIRCPRCDSAKINMLTLIPGGNQFMFCCAVCGEFFGEVAT